MLDCLAITVPVFHLITTDALQAEPRSSSPAAVPSGLSSPAPASCNAVESHASNSAAAADDDADDDDDVEQQQQQSALLGQLPETVSAVVMQHKLQVEIVKVSKLRPILSPMFLCIRTDHTWLATDPPLCVLAVGQFHMPAPATSCQLPPPFVSSRHLLPAPATSCQLPPPLASSRHLLRLPPPLAAPATSCQLLPPLASSRYLLLAQIAHNASHCICTSWK